jgi:D-alanyl-D-alanine carboxypeptidase
MRYISLTILFFLLITFGLLSAQNSSLYGETDPRDFLTGRFNPAKHEYFVDISKFDIPTDGRTHYLLEETAQQFAKLLKAFKEDHPGIKIYVSSATRNFYHQKAIWEGKYTGKRLVDGKKLNISIPDEYKRTLKILEFSSMPGTSRHHWGTDLDINSLVNSYYKSGEGKIIYEWFVKNAQDYGFYQVYTEGRTGGYNTEMWHWSYLPIARELYRDWLKYFSESTKHFSGNNAFKGSQYADQLAYTYVTEINPVCKK